MFRTITLIMLPDLYYNLPRTPPPAENCCIRVGHDVAYVLQELGTVSMGPHPCSLALTTSTLGKRTRW
jgi:hypothetical protein